MVRILDSNTQQRIILIDDILAVGNEAFQEKCLNKIKELVTNGKTILIVSHNRDRMEELTDIVFVSGGEIYEPEIS